MEWKEYYAYIGSIARLELDIRNRARFIHDDVNQKYDNHPYFYHLDKVGKLVCKYLQEIVERQEDIVPVLFGAYFHDSIEDARLTYNDVMKIAKEFMSEGQALLATEIVYALTNEKGRNRHERANEKYYAGIRDTMYAPLVKACDRLANYNYAKETNSRMVSCYEKEMEYFIGCLLLNDMNTDSPYSIPESLLSTLRNNS